MSQRDIARLASKLDQERARLYALLRSKENGSLARRPPSDEWSIIENVRHLLFAEQAHLGKFLPDRVEWSRLGLTQRTGKAFAEVGQNPTEDLEEVLRAWDAIHQPIREAIKGGGEEVEKELERHLAHLARHIDVIQSLLRSQSAR